MDLFIRPGGTLYIAVADARCPTRGLFKNRSGRVRDLGVLTPCNNSRRHVTHLNSCTKCAKKLRHDSRPSRGGVQESLESRATKSVSVRQFSVSSTRDEFTIVIIKRTRVRFHVSDNAFNYAPRR